MHMSASPSREAVCSPSPASFAAFKASSEVRSDETAPSKDANFQPPFSVRLAIFCARRSAGNTAGTSSTASEKVS